MEVLGSADLTTADLGQVCVGIISAGNVSVPFSDDTWSISWFVCSSWVNKAAMRFLLRLSRDASELRTARQFIQLQRQMVLLVRANSTLSWSLLSPDMDGNHNF